MANEYLTKAEFKATLEIAGEAFADADVIRVLEAASRQVDGYCGRRFYLDADANQVREYEAWDRNFVPIDDLVTLTTLQTSVADDGVYETTWLTTDYALEPANGPAKGLPYTRIRRRGPSTLSFAGYIDGFPSAVGYYQGMIPHAGWVKVTGRFGWPTIPPEVRTATSILAARLLKRSREAPFGIAAVGFDVSGAERISRTDPDVASLLAPYVRRQLVH